MSAPTVVFDLDKVLLSDDASLVFLRGRLHQAPWRALLLLAAAPLLIALAVLPQSRPLGARIMTRLAIGGRPEGDVDAVATAYREAVARTPEVVIADALAAVRRHRAAGDLVVVATGCEETLARGYLQAIGLGELEVMGSTGRLWPPSVRRTMGEGKVRRLIERGHPPPWAAAYSDSDSDTPLFAGTPRPVLVNADQRAAERVARELGRLPETATWR